MELRKKINAISFVVVLVFSTTTMNAQGRNDVIKAYNEGAAAVQTDPHAAIKAFENVVTLSKQVGDSAADLSQKAMKVLPSLYYNVASDAFTAKKPAAEVIMAAKKAVAASEKYENPTTKQNANSLLIRAYNNLASEYFSKDDYKNAIASFDSVLMINPDYASTIYNKALIYMKQANSENFEKTIDLYISKMKPGTDDAKIKQASTLALGYFRASGSKADQADKLDEALGFLNKAAKYGEDKDLFYSLPRFTTNRRLLIRDQIMPRKGWPLRPVLLKPKQNSTFRLPWPRKGRVRQLKPVNLSRMPLSVFLQHRLKLRGLI